MAIAKGPTRQATGASLAAVARAVEAVLAAPSDARLLALLPHTTALEEAAPRKHSYRKKCIRHQNSAWPWGHAGLQRGRSFPCRTSSAMGYVIRGAQEHVTVRDDVS